MTENQNNAQQDMAREVSEIKKAVNVLVGDMREMKQATLGDKSIGLNGLVDDMREMKSFRQSLTLKVAAVAGGVSVLIVGGKTVLTKLFG